MVAPTQAYSTIKNILEKYGGTIVSTRGSLTEGLDFEGDPFKPPQNPLTTMYSVATMPCYPPGNIVFGIEGARHWLREGYQAVVQLEKAAKNGRKRLTTVFIDLNDGRVGGVDISPNANGHLDDLATLKGMGLEEGVKALFDKICQNGHI